MRAVSLLDGAEETLRLDAAAAAAEAEALRACAAALQALHGAPEGQFPFAANERECLACPFVRACPRFHADGGEASEA